MSITVQTKTDTPEAVAAVNGADAKESAEEQKSAPVEETDENAEDSEISEEESVNSDEAEPLKDDDKPKKKSGYKRKIDKMHKKLSAKEQEAEYWKNEALRNRAKDSDITAQKSLRAKPDGKPKEDDFDSHADYVEALTDWKVDQKLGAERRKAQESQLNTEFEKRRETLAEKIQSFKKDHEDFDDLMEDVNDIQPSITVQDAIFASENGPKLMYALAQNPKEYERICKLPVVAAAIELGKIEARLSRSSEETKQLSKSKAPPPLKPVGSKSTGGGKKTIFDPHLSQLEYETLRREQMAKRA